MLHQRVIRSGLLLAALAGPMTSLPAIAASAPCVVRVCVASYGYHDANGNTVTVCTQWQEQIKNNCKPFAIDPHRLGPKLPPTRDRKAT